MKPLSDAGLLLVVAFLYLGCNHGAGGKGDGLGGGSAGVGGSAGSGGTSRGGDGGQLGPGGSANGGGGRTAGTGKGGGDGTTDPVAHGGGAAGAGGGGRSDAASDGISDAASDASGGSGREAGGGTGGSDASSTRGGAGGTAVATGRGGTTGTGTTSTGPCTPDWGTPPSGDSAWIDESWNAELGSNVKNRKEWLLDSAIQGKGQINICVRWGASSPPSSEVKTNMGAWVEKWLDDWFKNLAGYGCFPYDHIAAKVTGWAVRAGNQSWVSDLDAAAVKIYTDVETGSDPPNEPKCADACSFFTLDGKGNHSFANCPGGDAFHVDYAMWLDDALPGSGAAAVGGDWGLRMPVRDFVALKGAPSAVVEHEMGHGFGFQDYYTWQQDKPADGSLMIVGSTRGQTPSPADVWLLRRTWKEVKSLRGW